MFQIGLVGLMSGDFRGDIVFRKKKKLQLLLLFVFIVICISLHFAAIFLVQFDWLVSSVSCSASLFSGPINWFIVGIRIWSKRSMRNGKRMKSFGQIYVTSFAQKKICLPKRPDWGISRTEVEKEHYIIL